MKLVHGEMTEELSEKCEPLITLNHAESGHLKQAPEPAWDAFIEMGEDFIAFQMYTEEDELVGICFFIFGGYSHYSSMLTAHQLTFYVLPKYRKHVSSFMKYMEDELSKAGADIILQSAVIGTRFNRLLELKGYRPMNIEYIKELT